MIEAVVEGLPECDLVPPLDFIEKAVHPSDGLTFVVASEDDHLLGVPHLECEEQADDFAALLTSVDIVAHEKVTCILGYNVVVLLLLVLIAHFLEHVEEVRVLAVDVTKDLDWGFKLNQGFLVFE